MRKLLIATLFVSNIAYAGVCQNGHYIEHDGNTTIDYGTSEKCASVALAERDALSELTKPIPEEEFEQKSNRKETDAEKLINSILELF